MESIRRTGIEQIGDVPWGTHLCHFYESKEDLLDVLVPYFKAGLESDEYCMWITSEPLGVADSERALEAAMRHSGVPGWRDRIEILSHDEWYLLDGVFDLRRVLAGWAAKVEEARRRGLAGLRVTGNTAWLEPAVWNDFTDYEAEIDAVIGNYPMMAICTYDLKRCGAFEVLDVVSNHQFALIKRSGQWQTMESSDRKRAAEALRLSEERYRRIVDTAGEGIWMIDRDERTTFVNQRMAEMLGTAPEEMIGRPLSEFMPEGSWGTSAHNGNGHRRETSARQDYLFRRRDGGELWAIVSTRPILDAEGVRTGMLGMITDITDRKRIEAERERLHALEREARTRAEAEAELRERIMAVLGHDLRQPLTAILTSASVMKMRGELADTDANAVARIDRGARRMAAMISDLLDYTRIREAGGIPVSPQPCDLQEIVQAAAEECLAAHPGRNISVRFAGDLKGSWDRGRLMQVVVNLVANAVQHGGADSPVLVRAGGGDSGAAGASAETGEQVFIEVHNAGDPIPPEEMPLLFEAFHRSVAGALAEGEPRPAAGRRDRSPNGVGLGLYIVREIARAHGGTVEVRSTADEGTTFRVRLPRKSA